MPCSKCGAFSGANDQFCSKCGAPLQASPQQFSEIIEDTPENEVISTCPNCSAAATEGQLFCTVCGSPLLGDGGDE
ncbi:MAG TPA: zinc-ribbon domain-containing protein [Candidatus Binatia bacterium]|nr:zinc-ribbon domain-containing protein [Candidatus Binatia bacterium]